MFQRLDKLRKNAFASVVLFGSNNDSRISGIWVFRGQDLAFPVSNFTNNCYTSYMFIVPFKGKCLICAVHSLNFVVGQTDPNWVWFKPNSPENALKSKSLN